MDPISVNDQLHNKIIENLKKVYDPEIPVNVYDLGLIYAINISEKSEVYIKMTLTNPNCPVADKLLFEIKNEVSKIDDVTNVDIELVFEPKWSMDNISEAAKLELGLL